MKTSYDSNEDMLDLYRIFNAAIMQGEGILFNEKYFEDPQLRPYWLCKLEDRAKLYEFMQQTDPNIHFFEAVRAKWILKKANNVT